MTLKILDAAFETTTSTGTGDIVLAGAQAGFRSFAAAGNNAYVCYQINDGNAAGYAAGSRYRTSRYRHSQYVEAG